MYITFIYLIFIFLANKINSNDIKINRSILKQSSNDRNSKKISKFIRINGGSTKLDNDKSSNATVHPITVLVSTSFGSIYLDKKKSFILQSNSTIKELKTQINKKFPGCPPFEIQRLFFGVRLVNDNEIIRNITSMNPIPILLDIMSGTSVYDKSYSVTQALEAYTATTVQLSYVSDKLKALFNENFNNISDLPESSIYREMFVKLNETVYNEYHDSIEKALELEKDPETITNETEAWRQNNKSKSPVMKALAKEFDLNLRGIKGFLYYSIMLGFFAWYGTTGQGSSKFLLALVPVLWISKLRQLRIIFKIISHLVLPTIAKNNFILPLLSAPLQVIAIESSKWVDDEIKVVNEKSDNNLTSSDKNEKTKPINNMSSEDDDNDNVENDEEVEDVEDDYDDESDDNED